MGISFDHVEGVVQKSSEPSSSATPEGEPAATPKPTGESMEEQRRRMERLARRLHAD